MPRPAAAIPLLVLVFDGAALGFGGAELGLDHAALGGDGAEVGLDRAALGFDGTAAGDAVRRRVTSYVDAGVDWLQLRDRSLETDALHAFARDVVAGAREATRPARVIVNRRVDVALAAAAGGVHLGFDAMSVADARALLGPEASIGVSCHSVDEARAATGRGADYAHLAPIFDPLSKPAERPALGVDALRDAAAGERAVIAQGGVEPGRLVEIVAAGASGVAVTGHVLSAPDPVEAIRTLRARLDVL